MNAQSENPLFDEQDLLIRQAMNEVAVPHDAKSRARQRLLQAASEKENISETLMVAQADLPSVTVSGSRSRLSRARNFLVMHRRLASSLVVAASLIVATGVYFLTRPLDRQQLVDSCSQYLDQKLDPQPAWTTVQPDELRELLRSMGLSQLPQSILQAPLSRTPIGNGGQIWKFTYKGQKDLYVLELRGAVLIEGVGARVQLLQSSSNSWSVAASQSDQQLLVFMTKGSLEQYLRLVTLA